MAQKTQHHPQTAISRRAFLVSTGGACLGLLAGCVANPVTGRRQLIFLSTAAEAAIDRQQAPHQFSADYGITPDTSLASYMAETGQGLALQSHRPDMPYAFNPVNAGYVNAYAFPGGSMAFTRGILLAMQSESELAAVMGHEIGHVCARHAAQNMTRGMLTNVFVAGIATLLQQQQQSEYADLAAGLGMVAGGAFLAYYSRDDERQADALGLEYMVKAGHNPDGFIALMDTLRRLSRNKPGLIETMFATHPMSEERYQTAVQTVTAKYQDARSRPENSERYLDHTAAIRAMGEAINLMQTGEQALNSGKPDAAAPDLEAALRLAPEDYTALLLLAKCRMMQNHAAEAGTLAGAARNAYPNEPQAVHIAGLANLAQKRYAEAYENFRDYDRRLPGNPFNPFFQGLALEGQGHREEAARRYIAFLRNVQQGEQAQHAHRRLVEWGYIAPPAQRGA
ncbi:MAG: M48 family metalloprotease [Kiritimatiellia bacterium]